MYTDCQFFVWSVNMPVRERTSHETPSPVTGRRGLFKQGEEKRDELPGTDFSRQHAGLLKDAVTINQEKKPRRGNTRTLSR